MQKSNHDRAVNAAGLGQYLSQAPFDAIAEACGRRFARLQPLVDEAYEAAFNAAHDRAERLADRGQYLGAEQLGDEITHEYRMRVSPAMRYPARRGWPKEPHPTWN